MSKTFIIFVITIILAFSFTGCKSIIHNTDDQTALIDDPDMVISDKKDNPVILDDSDIIVSDTTIKPEDAGTEDLYFGTFKNEDYTLSIEADESGMMNFTINSIIKDNKADRWSFKGYYSNESNLVNYSDAVRSEISYDKNGNEKSVETIYENGAGRIIFEDADHITWKSSSDRLDGNNEFVRE